MSSPLPLAVALEIAAQVPDALDASHEKGVIHPDLKPANIIVRGEWPSSDGLAGAVQQATSHGRHGLPHDHQVLGFGLARAAEAAEGAGAKEPGRNA